MRLGTILSVVLSAACIQAADPIAESLGLTPENRSLPLWTKPAESESEALSTRARSIHTSILIVGTASHGYGTAFVISKEHRLLATNAHVADIRHKAGRMLAIPNRSSHVFEIDEVWYHPGVVRKNKAGLMFRSADPAVGDVHPVSPDVAVLHVAGVDELPSEIPLAEPDEIWDAFAKPVAMIGFPGHDTVSWPGVGDNVQASYRSGVVARATDFFNDADAELRDRQRVQHTMQSWGGFSGSPLFLPNGSVLGLHNSGATISRGRRTANLQYGVRIDCLWELLAHHKLQDKVNVPVSTAELRLDRFLQPDPRLEKFHQVLELVQTARIRILEDRFREAGELLTKAIGIMPTFPKAHSLRSSNHLSYAVETWGGPANAMRLGQLDGFIAQMEWSLSNSQTALRLDPLNAANMQRFIKAQLNLKFAKDTQRGGRGRPESPEFRAALRKLIDSEELPAVVRANAATAYGETFRLVKYELPWNTRAIEFYPYGETLYKNRAGTYEELGRRELAAADRRKAAELTRSKLLSEQAWLLATSRDAAKRNGKEAVRLATEACRLVDYRFSPRLSALAAACAEAGDFDQAVKWATEALKLAETQDKSSVAAELRSYRNGEPWRLTN